MVPVALDCFIYSDDAGGRRLRYKSYKIKKFKVGTLFVLFSCKSLKVSDRCDARGVVRACDAVPCSGLAKNE